MKKLNKNIRQCLYWAASHSITELMDKYELTERGLSKKEVENLREEYGKNIFTYGKKHSVLKRLIEAFVNPFTVILLVLAIISVFTDIVLAGADDRNYITVIIITTMVFISGLLRFIQETRSGNVAEKLSSMIYTKVCVEREGVKEEILIEDVVVGDRIYLSAGDMIPADLRIVMAKDLFVSQSALTGESEPVEKNSSKISDGTSLIEASNLAFMGSNVVSGMAIAIVIATGNDTMFGSMIKNLDKKPPKTSFEKDVNTVSWVLIRFMLMMVPIVFVVNGMTKNDWMQALLFAISIAVGLTPEMLPMIVTTSLAKGALVMSKKKVIIKNLNAIQNLGSMDILCTDKTGTLTQDKVVLEYHLNIEGNEDERVLRHAFLNSYFQTGLKNLIDLAVISKQEELGAESLINRYEKIDEIPFDFERRRMSVVVKDREGKSQLVSKGAVEEMLGCCSYAECNGEVLPLTQHVRHLVLKKTTELNQKGMRVIAVAQKTNPAPAGEFSCADEKEMVLIGFLAFLDPPKPAAKEALETLLEYGVDVKVLTGDNEKVTRAICKEVGLNAEKVILGDELEKMSEEELEKEVINVQIFAKLSPSQKARIIDALKRNGHCVGYMGDGINDAAAMNISDVGISVDSAVDIAKEAASVVLLEKNLMVLEQGVIEGRKTYANMMKYIKMTASSNFGNMLSVLVASAFLPFLPMTSIQLILLNLVYDLSCTAISWDHVDEENLKKPQKWSASGISQFMLWMGPVSSIFDIITYFVMYFIICPMMFDGLLYTQISDPMTKSLYIALFQTGWFIESMWSQTLVIHMIRTAKIPFVQSCASVSLSIMSFIAIFAITLMPFTPIASALELSVLPVEYFGMLAMIIFGYIILTTLIKKIYIQKFGKLL